MHEALVHDRCEALGCFGGAFFLHRQTQVITRAMKRIAYTWGCTFAHYAVAIFLYDPGISWV